MFDEARDSEHAADQALDRAPEHAIEQLNTLIKLDADAVELYTNAIEHIDDLAIREDLELFRADHERHIADLMRVVIDLGGEPEEPARDFTGMLLEAVTAVRSATGSHGALAAMRVNEKHTNKVYDEAAESGLPPIAYELVLKNLEDERRHLAVIELHLDRLTAPAATTSRHDIPVRGLG